MVAAHKTISIRRLRPISFLLGVMPWWAVQILEGDEKQDGLRGWGVLFFTRGLVLSLQ